MEIDNFFGTGKYVLGILSIISALFNPLQGIVLGLFGLIIERDLKNDYTKKGNFLNKIGIVIGVIAWILGVVLLKTVANSQGLLPTA